MQSPIQGVAAGAIGSTCRALIPDAFSGASYHKMINYLTLAWGCGPILAPAIGGYLQHYVNWHAPLWFLAGYGLRATGFDAGMHCPGNLASTKTLNATSYWWLLQNDSHQQRIYCLCYLNNDGLWYHDHVQCYRPISHSSRPASECYCLWPSQSTLRRCLVEW
ncbi:MAG: multidrug effflux MFS transporter [Gammaproteobacteria bacterium]|nr:multidrug effflux MFS transporter [Gammaproteobacteria bacterium]